MTKDDLTMAKEETIIIICPNHNEDIDNCDCMALSTMPDFGESEDLNA